MTSRIRLPRLLPMTIGMLAIVLASKSTSLLRSAILNGQPAAFIAASWAAGPDAAPDKPGDKPGGKPAAKPGDYGQAIKPESGPAPPPTSEIPVGPPPMTDSEKAVLLDLRDRRQQLDAREAALTARESLLAAAEKKLSARVEELQGLQKQLEILDASHRQRENVAWQGLVKVYETMKPRDAAAIFNELGMPVLLAVIDRMKDAKAAAVLAAMTPDKARDVTTQLALLRTKPAAAVDADGKPVPNPTPDPASGAAPGKPAGSGT